MSDIAHYPEIIDAMGQPCPMPLLMLKRALKKANAPRQYLLKSLYN